MFLRLIPAHLLLAAFVFFSAQIGVAETIDFVTLDETTDDAWRTSDLPKPDVDGDNVYGTDGYLIAQYPDGDEANLLQPPFGTIEFSPENVLRYEGVGAEAHQAEFDDVLETGPGPVPDLVAGDYWIQGGGATGDEHEFFIITLDEPASFRLGIIVDQTPDNPPGLLWEAAREVRVTGSGGADSDIIDVVGPNEEWRDADVDYALFDITGAAGDVFTVWGVNDDRWGDHALGGVTIDIGTPNTNLLRPGDADQDLDFDQLDLVQVQIANKYLTGQAATWGEGDWDAAPGGEPGSPPAGDGLFNQLDIIAALNSGVYLTGPYGAIQSDGTQGDDQTSIVYNPASGEVAVDAPAGTELTSVNIDSAGGIFTDQPAQNLGGSFDNDADNNIFKATFGSSFGTLSFGNVAQTGLSEEFVLNDLTVVGSLAGGGDLGAVDLIYVPEPSTLAMLVFGMLFGLRRFRRMD